MSTLDPLGATRAAETSVPTFRSRGRSLATSNAVSIALLVVVFFLGIPRIDRYPATWFDEGSYLEVSRNIANERLYAARSGDGTLDFAPVVSVGPTVLLPVAGVIWLQGNTIQAARAIAVLFLILASLSYFLTLERAFGQLSALISILFLLSMPAIRWIANGRQVAGEVPAIFFLLVGAALAFRIRGARGAMLAGIVLGLAIVTKPQYLTLLPLSVVMIGLVDRLGEQARPVRWYVSILGGMSAAPLVWFASLVAIIGPSDVRHQVDILRATGHTTLLVIRDLEHYLASLRFVLGLPAFFLVLPATVYGIVLVQRAHGDRRLMLLSIVVFQTVWLSWFLLLSNGWPRYAFPGLVVSTILMGLLITDVFRALLDTRTADGASSPGVRTAAGGAALLAVGLLAMAGAWRVLTPIATDGSTEAQTFAAEMSRIVPAQSAVDGWEPEINFLSDREMVYPPVGTLSPVTEAHVSGTSVDIDPPAPQTEFLIIGEFGRLVGLYEPVLAEHEYVLRLTVGRYELYQRTH